jgi:hypothetical protein
VPSDLDVQPSVGGDGRSRLLIGLGLTTLAVLVSVEALLAAGLLWFASAPVEWPLRLFCGGLWLLPYVVTAVVWRVLVRNAAYRHIARLLTLEAALLVFLPIALLGFAGWFA